MLAAAQAEEKEREKVQEEIAEVEQHMVALLPSLGACSNPHGQQVRSFIMLYCPSLKMELDICKKAVEKLHKYDILYVRQY